MTWLFVFIGGGLGSLFRFVLSGLLQSSERGFPWGTLTVNVFGCFMLGYLLFTEWSWARIEMYRAGVAIGVLGGFTTFSTFGVESLRLSQAGQVTVAILYVGLSIFGGLLAAYLGFRLASGAS